MGWGQLRDGQIWLDSADLGIGTGSGGAVPPLGPWGPCQANGNSTMFRGLAVAANVVAVSGHDFGDRLFNRVGSFDGGPFWRGPLAG